MLKIFGGQIHEVSEIRNDKQISLQLYKDARNILHSLGGVFSLFNSKSTDYIKAYEKALSEDKVLPSELQEFTPAYYDLKNFLDYKILSLTKEIRGSDFKLQAKTLKAEPQVIKRAESKKSNVVIVLEEGLIPKKTGKVFDFGLRGAVDAVQNPGAKAFISTVGAAILTSFAMEKLGISPHHPSAPGSFAFGYEATKLAVQEAAIQFELPMIEEITPPKRYELFIQNEEGKTIEHLPLPLISENGEIAKIILEEDVISRYVKTGTRVAIKHIVAIVAAMQIYNNLKGKSEFIAKTAAMATYVASTKGIAMMEKADTRYWSSLPQSFRMTELHLVPGKYTALIAPYHEGKPNENALKTLGEFKVIDSNKKLHTFNLVSP
jgi:hypothetical protein